MARGAQAKTEILAKLMSTFEGSFMQDDKILRIPWNEAGDIVEIKVTLTAAKDVIGAGVAPTSAKAEEFNWEDPPKKTGVDATEAAAEQALSADEKERIKRMMEALGL